LARVDGISRSIVAGLLGKLLDQANRTKCFGNLTFCAKAPPLAKILAHS
jgi:hypothetical protein